MECKDLAIYKKTLERTSTGRRLFTETYECKALWWAELTLDGEGKDDDDDHDWLTDEDGEFIF